MPQTMSICFKCSPHAPPPHTFHVSLLCRTKEPRNSLRTKELVFSLAMKKHFLYLISFKYSIKKMKWLRGKIDDATKTLNERNRFSLTCLLAVYNLFIHGVCVLDHCLEGLDHLQGKHPDRRSHGQLDAGGSLLGPGPPPATQPPT